MDSVQSAPRRYGEIRRGVSSKERAHASRERVAIVIRVLGRIGQLDLLVPRFRDKLLWRMLAELARSADPSSAEGAAIIATLEREPQTLSQYLRRHRAWARALIESHERQRPSVLHAEAS